MLFKLRMLFVSFFVCYCFPFLFFLSVCSSFWIGVFGLIWITITILKYFHSNSNRLIVKSDIFLTNVSANCIVSRGHHK